MLALKPSPRPQPDRVQLTLTGNAIVPSLSPDGTRIAFAEKQCDQAGDCTYQLVIQDRDGTGRIVLTDTGKALLTNPKVKEAYLGG